MRVDTEIEDLHSTFKGTMQLCRAAMFRIGFVPSVAITVACRDAMS